MLMRSKDSVLFVVDVQERLLPAMTGGPAAVERLVTLMTAARELGVPVLVSEQYPKGLGPSVPEVLGGTEGPILPKVHFSCLRDPSIREEFEGLKRRQAVVAGIEAHVCVLQTAMDLLEEGYEVFVVADATASRRKASHRTAMTRLCSQGAGVVTTEMVLFEWLEQAGTPEFRTVSKLIR